MYMNSLLAVKKWLVHQRWCFVWNCEQNASYKINELTLPLSAQKLRCYLSIYRVAPKSKTLPNEKKLY